MKNNVSKLVLISHKLFYLYIVECGCGDLIQIASELIQEVSTKKVRNELQ